MASLYYFILKSIAGSILGSAFNSWFKDTAVGIWCYDKVNSIMNWAADRYKLEKFKEVNRFYDKYPEIAARLDALEEKAGIKQPVDKQ